MKTRWNNEQKGDIEPRTVPLSPMSAVFSAMERIKKKGKMDVNQFKEDIMECIKREPDLLG